MGSGIEPRAEILNDGSDVGSAGNANSKLNFGVGIFD